MNIEYARIVTIIVGGLAGGACSVFVFATAMEFFGRRKESPRMSEYGIRLPAPKLDLPDHFKSHEDLLTWISRHREISANPTAKLALITYCRHWRIERSRAADLERMVEQLEMENRQLRKPRITTRILSLLKRKP